MIDEKLKAAIERALAAGFRVQLKRMKDGTVKAQIIKAEELKKIIQIPQHKCYEFAADSHITAAPCAGRCVPASGRPTSVTLLRRERM